MNTIFIGGSREISELPIEVEERLRTIGDQKHQIIVGDANGTDKAVQQFLATENNADVVVFCSGDKPRHNVGHWPTHVVLVESKNKDFKYFAAKDQEMARRADFGLMVWDGKSPGTLLNIVRLVQGGKIAILYNVPHKKVLNFKTAEQLRLYLSTVPKSVMQAIDKRASDKERTFLSRIDNQPSLLEQHEQLPKNPHDTSQHQMIVDLNAALSSGSLTDIMGILGKLARDRSMSAVARDAGLARESLYRSLDADGNPEFATILKVLASLNLELEVRSSRK